MKVENKYLVTVLLLLILIAGCISVAVPKKMNLREDLILHEYDTIRGIIIEEAANHGFYTLVSEIIPSEINKWKGKLYFEEISKLATIDHLTVKIKAKGDKSFVEMRGAGAVATPKGAIKAIEARLGELMIYSSPSAGENIEMDRFSLAVKLGKNWKCTRYRETQKVIFSDHPFRSILVREMDASEMYSGIHSERWVADAYRRGEEADMIARGVQKGMYKLKDVRKFELKVDQKNLYAMTYRQLMKDYIGYGYLYLYFPNFKESNKFYVFLYFAIPEGKAQEVSMEEFHSIIRGFNLQ